MNVKHLVFFISIFVIVLMSAVILFNFFIAYETEEIDMHLVVSDASVTEANLEGLDFGTLKKINLAHKSVVISNIHSYARFYSLFVEGSIEPLVSLPETDFVLEPNEQKNIKVSILLSKEVPTGEYSGIFTITSKREW